MATCGWLFVLYIFIRFVRPTKMSEQAINKYIEGKYGEVGVDRYATSIYRYSGMTVMLVVFSL